MANISRHKLDAMLMFLNPDDADKVYKILLSKKKTRKELFELARSLR